MAENLVDGEFWLPAQFLADEEVFDAPFDPKDATLKGSNGNESSLFPSEFPYGFASSSSDHSSPVESLGGGSSETDSDEEEQIIAEIRRQIISRSSHQTDLKSANNTVGRSASGSPQSTLCAFGSGCGCRQGSSQGSPNGACEHSSARATWDLLHAAAGEVERMRLSQEGYIFGHHNQYSGLFSPRRKSSFFTEPSKNNSKTNPYAGFHTHQSLHQQQLQIAQMLRQNQMPKQPNSVWGVQNNSGGVYQQRQNNPMAQNRGRNSDVTGGDARTIRPLGLSPSAWPPLQHARQQQQNSQYGSGMRAIFIGNPSGRRERAGTGVFLPRQVDTPGETRRRPAYSTVLVPTRVVQALNLQLDDLVGGQPQPLHQFNPISNMGNAAVPRVRSHYVPSQH